MAAVPVSWRWRWRWRWRAAGSGVLTVLTLLVVTGRYSDRPGPWPSPGCLRIFQLSSSHLCGLDPEPGLERSGGSRPAEPAVCLSGALSADAARACLRRRAARLRRPARLVLVGDSRSRILQQQLQSFLQLDGGSEPEDVRAEDVPPGPLRELQLYTTSQMCHKADKFCSRRVSDPLLRVEFWRRPYLAELFLHKLRQLVAACRARSPSCPDLVVLNGGMWYARMTSHLAAIEKSPGAWMLKLREHVRTARAVIAELSEVVTVIWRLEEATTSDVLTLKRKEEYQKRLSASHALFYDLQNQVAGLVVWSSMLPETLDYAQRVCGSVKNLTASDDPAIEEIFDQCDDEIHVGTAMRQRFVSKLLDVLCEVDGDREDGHCCRSW